MRVSIRVREGVLPGVRSCGEVGGMQSPRGEGVPRHTQGCCGGVWREEGVPRLAQACDGGGRPDGPTSLRCSFGWPCRRTRFAACGRCTQTTAASQILKRAARAGQPPCAARRLPRTPERAGALLPGHGGGGRRGRATARPAGAQQFAEQARCVVAKHLAASASRQAVPGGGDLWGDEERRLEGGARSALQHLTRSSCLSAAAAGRVASSAARLRVDAVSPDREQSLRTVLCLANDHGPAGPWARSAVGLQGRPPHRSPHRAPPAAMRSTRRMKQPSKQARHQHQHQHQSTTRC